MGFRVMLLGNSLVPRSVNYVWGDMFKDEKPKEQITYNIDFLWGGQLRVKDIDHVINHLSECRMAMLVFQTKDRVGYEQIKEWALKIRALYPKIYIQFIGNKATATEYRAVAADEAHEFAKLHKMCYNETSNFTKTFEGINRDFSL